MEVLSFGYKKRTTGQSFARSYRRAAWPFEKRSSTSGAAWQMISDDIATFLQSSFAAAAPRKNRLAIQFDVVLHGQLHFLQLFRRCQLDKPFECQRDGVSINL